MNGTGGQHAVCMPIMERGHGELVKRLNNLRGAIRKQVCRYTIEDAIAYLEEYAEVRFCEEERYMRHYVYPGYHAHKEKHEQFAEDIYFLREELQNVRALGLKGSYELSVETVRVISDWIHYHVLLDDRRLGEFLRQYPDTGPDGLFPASGGEERITGGILTICSHCHRIRGKKGLWKQKEKYTRIPRDASYSHSVCPECLQNYYADLFEEKR